MIQMTAQAQIRNAMETANAERAAAFGTMIRRVFRPRG